MSVLPTIPNYYVGKLIAEGGTARVYWGVDKRSGFPVAIKELKIKYLKNNVLRDKFKFVETQMYLYMDHPNIPKLVDFLDFPDREQMFIVMEFVEGSNLEAFLHSPRHKALSDKSMLILFLEILDTVAYMHRNGVLHLDIKPGNVMLKPDGNIKLIDLGIASRVGEYSSTGYGTPSYMAPEQSERGHCGVYTDIFSLGIMLFELLTCHLPFLPSSDDPRIAKQELRMKIRNEKTPAMQQYRPGISDKLQRIVERALEKDPKNRYQDCASLKKDVVEYLGNKYR